MIQLKTERSKAIYAMLHKHVDARLQKALAKWNDRSDLLARQEINKAKEKFELSSILEKGLACCANIAVATHIAKAIHPDLKVKRATNLNVRFGDLHKSLDIGSHLLSDEKSLADVTGDGAYNSAAYELYLLLDLHFDETPLSKLIHQGDWDAISAFSWNAENDDLREAAKKYTSLLDEKTTQFSSNAKAKQIYWCITGDPADNSNFHLLQPLFPSSLVHEVHRQINEARFGEQNTAARHAYFNKFYYPFDYRYYRGLVIRTLGGTKPQNISQLNSERGGVNYLLSSLPPRWNHDPDHDILNPETVFDRFYQFEGVSCLIKALVKYLKANPEPTHETVKLRETYERALGESLVAFGLIIRELHESDQKPNTGGQLSECAHLWCDPLPIEIRFNLQNETEDSKFKHSYVWKDWFDEIAHRFSHWFNTILLKEGLHIGGMEHTHWVTKALIDIECPIYSQCRALKKETD